MDSFEINKIIAAVLVVFLFVFGISKISNLVYHVEKPNKSAYKVEVVKASSSKDSSTTEAVDISALLVMGSVEHGQKIFKKCSACHSVKKSGKNKIAQKIGEESTELIIDYLNGSKKRTVEEASDLIYHLLVLLYSKKISIKDIKKELTKRQNVRR